MREIKFRGKAGNGEWVYGDLIHTPEHKTRIIWFEEKSDWYCKTFTITQN